MRVGIDGRSLVGPGGRGIARYTRTLLNALAAGFPDDEWRVLVPAGPRSEPPLRGADVVRVRLPPRALYGLSGTLRWPRLDTLLGGTDVFWAPAPAPMALSPGVPFVMTLHDLSWELRQSDFTPYERVWHRIAAPRTLAKRAARIIAVSDTTRSEAIEHWQLDPRKLVTIREGIPPPEAFPHDSRAGTQAVRGPAGPYFLIVGALEPRKAPDVLIRAHHRARAQGLNADLVVAGEGRLQATLSGPGVHLLGHVTDSELDQLYTGALAVVMPSRLEGFGLPPLEAAVRGTPAILTDLPVFRETLGDAALRVAVDDVDGLAAALIRLATDAQLRGRLGALARDRAAHCTPQRSAAAVRAVLADVAAR